MQSPQTDVRSHPTTNRSHQVTRTEHEVLRICALAHRKLDELGYPKTPIDLREHVGSEDTNSVDRRCGNSPVRGQQPLGGS